MAAEHPGSSFLALCVCVSWSVFGCERESRGDSEDLRQHAAQLVEHFLRDTLSNKAEVGKTKCLLCRNTEHGKHKKKWCTILGNEQCGMLTTRGRCIRRHFNLI